jgi:hypothetical protein
MSDPVLFEMVIASPGVFDSGTHTFSFDDHFAEMPRFQKNEVFYLSYSIVASDKEGNGNFEGATEGSLYNFSKSVGASYHRVNTFVLFLSSLFRARKSISFSIFTPTLCFRYPSLILI